MTKRKFKKPVRAAILGNCNDNIVYFFHNQLLGANPLPTSLLILNRTKLMQSRPIRRCVFDFSGYLVVIVLGSVLGCLLHVMLEKNNIMSEID